jgi:hypothetical protein
MHSLRLAGPLRIAAWVLCGASLLAVEARLGFGQPAKPQRSAIQGSVDTHQALLSPSVEATWVVREKQLVLLILWRGQPGWSQRQPSGFVNDGVKQTLVRGAIRLSQRYDEPNGVVQIQGSRTELSGNNVVFVDAVDSPQGARVIGHMRIESAMPGSAAQIGQMLAGSAPIMAFLRCDALRAGLQSRAWLERLCLETIGIPR